MATNVKVEINPTQQILLKRYLGKNGKAQVEFTKLVALNSDKYIPFKTGRLKNMMITIDTDKITYNAPYAAKQYYTNKGEGRGGESVGGLRGKRWDRRMWISNGDKIVQSIAEFVGGRSK